MRHRHTAQTTGHTADVSPCPSTPHGPPPSYRSHRGARSDVQTAGPQTLGPLRCCTRVVGVFQRETTCPTAITSEGLWAHAARPLTRRPCLPWIMHHPLSHETQGEDTMIDAGSRITCVERRRCSGKAGRLNGIECDGAWRASRRRSLRPDCCLQCQHRAYG